LFGLADVVCSQAYQQAWLINFVNKTKEGSEPVLNLVRTQSVPDNMAEFLRATRYRYQTPTEQQQTRIKERGRR